MTRLCLSQTITPPSSIWHSYIDVDLHVRQFQRAAPRRAGAAPNALHAQLDGAAPFGRTGGGETAIHVLSPGAAHDGLRALPFLYRWRLLGLCGLAHIRRNVGNSRLALNNNAVADYLAHPTHRPHSKRSTTIYEQLLRGDAERQALATAEIYVLTSLLCTLLSDKLVL